MEFRQNADKNCTKRDPGLASQVSKSLYNGGVSTSIAKVVISFEKSNIECVIDPLINQPPHPDMLLLCHCFEFVPGIPVNGDDHLHPLVLWICRFPTTPRSCTSPCLVCHTFLNCWVQVTSTPFLFEPNWMSMSLFQYRKVSPLYRNDSMGSPWTMICSNSSLSCTSRSSKPKCSRNASWMIWSKDDFCFSMRSPRICFSKSIIVLLSLHCCILPHKPVPRSWSTRCGMQLPHHRCRPPHKIWDSMPTSGCSCVSPPVSWSDPLLVNKFMVNNHLECTPCSCNKQVNFICKHLLRLISDIRIHICLENMTESSITEFYFYRMHVQSSRFSCRMHSRAASEQLTWVAAVPLP